MFLKAVGALRAAGAEVIADDGILPPPSRAPRAASRPTPTCGMGRTSSSRRSARGLPLGGRVPKGRRHPAFCSSIGVEDHFRTDRGRADRAAVGSTPIPMRSGSITRRAARRWPPTWSRSMPAARWLRLPGHPDAASGRDDAAGRRPERRAALEHELGQHDWRAGRGRPGRLLRERPSLRPGVPARPWTDGDLLGDCLGVGAGDAQVRKPPVLVEHGLLRRDARARSADW